MGAAKVSLLTYLTGGLLDASMSKHSLRFLPLNPPGAAALLAVSSPQPNGTTHIAV